MTDNLEKMSVHSLPSLLIPERFHLPEIGAVYFVLNEKSDIEYIGKAKNLRKRWRKHECCIDLDNPKSCRVAWVEIEKEAERYEFEKRAISIFNPQFNIQCLPKAESIIIPKTNVQIINSEYFTTKEAADALNVSAAYIRQMIIAGTITGAKKFGRDNAVPKSEIERLKNTTRKAGRPKENK